MNRKGGRAAGCVLLLAAAASHAAGNCDTIRAEVDAKVRRSGVTNFTLRVVDAAAKAPGKVVGTCELGSKKILYSAASAPAGGERILTECRDGSVSYGDCPK